MKVKYSMVRKNISLPKDQVIWLKKNHISLSKFIQDKIKAEMKKRKNRR